MLRPLDPQSLQFETSSIVDEAGRVFYLNGRVLRLVTDPHTAEVFREVLEAEWCGELFNAGLIQTWIPADISVSDAELVLEHERVAFQSHPCEYTNRMHWEAALTLLNVGACLARHGLVLSDAHPWNFMIHRGRPIFVDFGSITRGDQFSSGWLNEFYTYFMAPICLAASRFSKLAPVYRREHRSGFGLKLMSYPLVRKLIMGFRDSPERGAELLGRLESWLRRHKPKETASGPWSTYEQAHGAGSGSQPTTEKQSFVLDSLRSCQPATVLDCAANNGFYALMAAEQGASVAAFDIQSDCVDEILGKTLADDLDITAVLMDFLVPTPPFGLGLTGKSAFERYQCDMVLALGLVHHICLSQNVPLELFCHICARFARKDLVIEFVHLDDKHLQTWNITRASGYSLKELVDCLSRKGWSERTRVELQDSGLSRTMVHFQHARHPPVAE